MSDKALKMLCGRLQAVNRIAFIARNSIARLYIEDKRPLLQRHHRGFPREPARVDAFCSPANQPGFTHRFDDRETLMDRPDIKSQNAASAYGRSGRGMCLRILMHEQGDQDDDRDWHAEKKQ
ncbi:hypothetical protein [Pseudomonas sp. PDM31]|uniref:hypothetical protein n=1 Tax=Pseudomonas sp. PDM31 TaxID=2854778 RepID=UPI001C466109|nr:hypothetical protein [Pseudomonas sp. PDM31]MBV7476552.1 hypothetical protein [Pseudomonas sp. PDM31]